MGLWDDLSRFAGNLTGGFIGESDDERKRRLKKESLAGREQRESTYAPKGVDKIDFNTNYRSNINDLLRRRYSYDEISQETGLDRKIISDYGQNILGKYWNEQEEVDRENANKVLEANQDIKKKYDDYLSAGAWKQRAMRQQLENELYDIAKKGKLDDNSLTDISKTRFLENLIHTDDEPEKGSLFTAGADVIDALKTPFENLLGVGYQLGNLTFNDKDVGNKLGNLVESYKKGDIDARTLQLAYQRLAGGDKMSWQHGIKFDEKEGLREAKYGEKVGGFAGGIFETGSDAAVFLPMAGVTVDIPAQFTAKALTNYALHKAGEGAIYTFADTLAASLRGQPLTVQEMTQKFLANTVLDFMMDSVRELAVAPLLGKAKNILSGVDDNGNAIIPRLLSQEEVSRFTPDAQRIYLDSLAAVVDPDGIDAGLEKLVKQYPGRTEIVNGKKVYIKGIGERLQETKAYSLKGLRKQTEEAVASGGLDLSYRPEATKPPQYGKVSKYPAKEKFDFTPTKDSLGIGIDNADTKATTNFTENDVGKKNIASYADNDYELVDGKRTYADPETNQKPFLSMSDDVDSVTNLTEKVNRNTGEISKKNMGEAYLDYLLLSRRFSPNSSTNYERYLLNELSDYIKSSPDVQASIAKSGEVSDAFQKEFREALAAKKDVVNGVLTKQELKSLGVDLEALGIKSKPSSDVAKVGTAPTEAPKHITTESEGVARAKTETVAQPEDVSTKVDTETKVSGDTVRTEDNIKVVDKDRLAYDPTQIRDIELSKGAADNRRYFSEVFKDQPKDKIAKSLAHKFGLDQQVVARLITKLDGDYVDLAVRLQDMSGRLVEASNKNAYATAVINGVVKAGKSNPTLAAIKVGGPPDTPRAEITPKTELLKDKIKNTLQIKKIEADIAEANRLGNSTALLESNLKKAQKALKATEKKLTKLGAETPKIATSVSETKTPKTRTEASSIKVDIDTKQKIALETTETKPTKTNPPTTEEAKPTSKKYIPKDGKDMAEHVQVFLPGTKKANVDELSKGIKAGGKSVGDYFEYVKTKIDESGVGWDRFYDEIYYHAHADKNLRKPMSKEVVDLYNTYFKDYNEFMRKSGNIIGEQVYYFPQTKSVGEKTTVYGNASVYKVDAEDFGFSKRREYKIAYNELDKSPQVMKRHFEQYYMSKYPNEMASIKSQEVADAIFDEKVKKISGPVTEEIKTKIKEEIQQSPDGSRSPEYFKKDQDIADMLIKKTKKALETDTPAVPEANYEAKKAVKPEKLGLMAEYSELGRVGGLKQTTIDNKVGVLRDRLQGGGDLLSSIKVGKDNNLYKATGLELYEHSRGLAGGIIEGSIEYTVPKNKIGGGLDTRNVKITNTNNISTRLEKMLRNVYAEYKLNIGETNLKKVIDDATSGLKDIAKKIPAWQGTNGIKLSDWDKIGMLQESVARSLRNMSRLQFTEAAQRLVITDPRLNTILDHHGTAILLGDKITKSIMEQAANRMVGKVSAGLLGLKPKAALFNLFEPKRLYGEFGIAKTVKATEIAMTDFNRLLSTYGIKPPINKDGVSLFYKMLKDLNDAKVNDGFVTEYTNLMGKLNSSVEGVESLGKGQFGATRALFGDSYMFQGKKIPTSDAGSILKETGKTVTKIDDVLNELVMTPFNTTESFKDAVYLACYELAGKEKGLSGIGLRKFVMENYNKMAIKQGQFGAIGLHRHWAGRLLTQFAGYPLKEAKIKINKISPMFRLSSDISSAERVAAGKYLARTIVADSLAFYMVNKAFNTTFDNVFGLQVPGVGPLPTMVKYYMESLAEQRENEESKAKAEAAGFEYDENTYKKTKFTKSLAALLPGGDQLLNKTGIHALINENSILGKTLRDMFPDGYLKAKQEGFDRNSKGRIRFEMEQKPSFNEWLTGVLDGEYTSKNAKEYFGNTDPLSGVPIIGRYFKGEHGYPVWKSINDKIDKATTLEDKQSIYRDFLKRVKEDKALEKAFLESASDASKETYLKLNNKTLVHNKSELERLGDKVGLGDLAREIDSVINGPQDSYYRTKYDDKGKKVESFISPEKWNMLKDKTVFDKQKQDFVLRNKRDGVPLDPIYKLESQEQISQILELRGLPTGDDKEKKDMLRAGAEWYREFEEDMATYREANKKYYDKNPYASKDQERVVKYNDLSQQLYDLKPPSIVQRYFDIKERQGKEDSNAFYKANENALNGGFDSWNRARLKIINELRKIEGVPPMTIEQLTNDTYGYKEQADSGYSYSKSSGGSSSYHPYTGVAETIGKVRPESGSGIKLSKYEVKTTDPSKAFKKSRAKQTSPIRIKI